MFTNIPIIDYLIWSGLRLLLYQLLLVFAFYNYYDLPKYALEFKENMFKFATLSKITYSPAFKARLENPENIFLIILGIIVVSGILAALGFKLFQFLSGVIVITIAMVYYHPLRPSELAPGEEYQAYSQKYPWIDTVLISLFGLLMIFHSLKNFKDEDFNFLLEKDEQKVTESKKNK